MTPWHYVMVGCAVFTLALFGWQYFLCGDECVPGQDVGNQTNWGEYERLDTEDARVALGMAQHAKVHHGHAQRLIAEDVTQMEVAELRVDIADQTVTQRVHRVVAQQAHVPKSVAPFTTQLPTGVPEEPEQGEWAMVNGKASVYLDDEWVDTIH